MEESDCSKLVYFITQLKHSDDFACVPATLSPATSDNEHFDYNYPTLPMQAPAQYDR